MISDVKTGQNSRAVINLLGIFLLYKILHLKKSDGQVWANSVNPYQSDLQGLHFLPFS